MIIAIETATDVCGTALVHNGAVVAQRTIREKNVHSERLLPMVDELLREASVALTDLDAICISIGPGSFTGLRIGLSTAKGLAVASSTPVVAVPTLDALAYEYFRNAPHPASGIVAPLIDAKRDEAFYSFYELHSTGVRRLRDYGIEPVANIFEEASRYRSVVFAGDGARKMQPMTGANAQYACMPETVCNPAAVGIIGEKGGKALSAEQLSTLEPLYLREFVTTVPGNSRGRGTRAASSAQPTTAHLFKG
ncbi:MAG TPA: tRNA (adenosine(37)-N6)-threonylcarbamoyltransferase complex dimerization subunit type 1 TsaB [Bacteroidota bacterium]|nr:tRNA (adenosine(37)-N6)-threonylcarbamoyltransferase complex dimerization subunit type 1 TsaB [Bacteroidota bacterium]